MRLRGAELIDHMIGEDVVAEQQTTVGQMAELVETFPGRIISGLVTHTPVELSPYYHINPQRPGEPTYVVPAERVVSLSPIAADAIPDQPVIW